LFLGLRERSEVPEDWESAAISLEAIIGHWVIIRKEKREEMEPKREGR
jgi:hypothetical protein